jgi:Sec-independent protein translocase protein TatA
MQIGFWEVLIVILIGIVLFASSLPALGRLLGRSVNKIQKGFDGESKDDSNPTLPD